LGSYEADKQELLTTLPLAGKTVLDIGANVGFFSLLFSRLVGPSGRVVAFEPFPRNLEFIHRHIALNSASNIEVRPVTIADKHGTTYFSTSQFHEQGSLSDDGDLEVAVTTLDALEPQEPEIALVKIDVEGAESAVLEGGKHFFEANRQMILLATHSREQVIACQEILSKYDYKERSI
jgi:FkbM family methyltransferase